MNNVTNEEWLRVRLTQLINACERASREPGDCNQDERQEDPLCKVGDWLRKPAERPAGIMLEPPVHHANVNARDLVGPYCPDRETASILAGLLLASLFGETFAPRGTTTSGANLAMQVGRTATRIFVGLDVEDRRALPGWSDPTS